MYRRSSNGEGFLQHRLPLPDKATSCRTSRSPYFHRTPAEPDGRLGRELWRPRVPNEGLAGRGAARVSGRHRRCQVAVGEQPGGTKTVPCRVIVRRRTF